MPQYTYDGPVMAFDKLISERWTGTTFADTERKARVNLAYQFKKQNNRIPATKIYLPGNVIALD
jgi:hypothetical protein